MGIILGAYLLLCIGIPILSQNIAVDPLFQSAPDINRYIQSSIVRANTILQNERSVQRQNAEDPTRRGTSKTYLWHHARVTNGPNYHIAKRMSKNAAMIQLSQDLFMQNFPLRRARTIVSQPAYLQLWRRHVTPYCTYRPPPIRCNPNDRFRTADGTCNNIRNPKWGATMSPHQRFLPPAYADGRNAPRVLSVTGVQLPSARVISNVVHNCGICRQRGRLTTLVMVFGQFRDHDISLTPNANDEAEQLDCCKPENFNNRDCFPIPIPPGDPRFGNQGCMTLARSLEFLRPHCEIGPREQFNEITALLDSSSVYGSTLEHQRKLRLGRDGLMKVSNNNLLPISTADQCILSRPGEHCFDAGDSRRHEMPTLTSIHTIFVRNHNRRALQLKAINPHWNDERLFQETRKIEIATLQHVTYNEFLPLVVGRKHMDAFGLTVRRRGHNTVYNPNVDPSTANAFTTAAFRFGHSLIPGEIPLAGRRYVRDANVPLQTQFDRPFLVFQRSGVTRIMRGIANTLKSRMDGQVNGALRNDLFLDAELNSMDLAALNIQRGRDHGLPSYNQWRKFCGYRPVIHFGRGPGGLEHHNQHYISLLAKVYRNPEDMDLFTAGLAESPVSDGLLGPVFACIVAKQFKHFKEGDRFWFENNFPNTGFTLDQVNEIKKSTLSRMLCEGTTLGEIQPSAFFLPSVRNRRQPCITIPKINLNFWREANPLIRIPGVAIPGLTFPGIPGAPISVLL